MMTIRVTDYFDVSVVTDFGAAVMMMMLMTIVVVGTVVTDVDDDCY